jgi:uncharacterized protein
MKRWLVLLLIASAAHAGPAERVQLATAAHAQVGVTRGYDPAYVRLRYPGGDVPLQTGVCADVIVRAFRKIGVDLQVTLHEDMRRNFARYPRRWGLSEPDANIDHRRVPNLMTFFERKGKSVAIASAYEPGDVVAWRLPGGLHHIGIVSDVRNTQRSEYLVVHNIGSGARNEDVLREFEIIAHYRW